MSTIRALRQLTASSSRAFAATRQQLPGTVARPLAHAARVSAGAAQVSVRAFSGSVARFGEADIAFSQKLQEELNYEKEANAELAETPEFLKAFQQQGIWQIDDIPGNDEVVLTRKFGNENIRMMFSIADIEDGAQEDFENPESESEGQDGAEEPINSYPIRTSLSITKTTGPGCINVDMVCQDGHFIVENVSFYKDASIGTDLTAEADWKRRGVYIGPQFDTLDVGVQEEFEKYLQERGVNEHVALFIPEYAEHKEQAEYVKWLGNVKAFVDM